MSKGAGWIWLAFAVAGLALLADPKCKHGCRTVAEHVFTYGLEGLFSST